MKELFYTILVSFSLTVMAAGCGNSGSNAIPWEKMTPRQRLEAVRSDTERHRPDKALSQRSHGIPEKINVR